MTGPVEIAAKTEAIIGESPVWSTRRRRLPWIDIMGGQFHCYDPETGHDVVTRIPTASGLLTESPEGEIVLGLDCDLARLGPDGRIIRFAHAPHGAPTFRFNDGKYDRQGLTCNNHERGLGNFYIGFADPTNPR